MICENEMTSAGIAVGKFSRATKSVLRPRKSTGKLLRRFHGNLLERSLSVHCHEKPSFGKTGLGKHGNKLTGPLSQRSGCNTATLKCGLVMVHRAMVFCRTCLKFPTPNVIRANQVRVQSSVNFLS